MPSKTRSIEILEIATGKVVHAVSVEGKSESQIERIERGMLINLDRDRYCTRESTRSVRPETP